ncbi:Lrp/AsnC family transcriptional regulator [Candidatus Micrarchaeota archaeon]|nr:Lrp/AsnC family transcriptional regulator [Candidatus Micrarchaeota archaeon]MBU1166761.1 Lrp/AsnC family transcriptional regulator [Candidatus Micrarchaeota archaeon]MBU1887241.1 Lrp/AsnC family transcriptional regulator [Candidatus Micrarchaeota archaeon]
MKKKNKDEQLLSILQENSRMSNVEIAKTLGLTEGAVRSRIKRLVKDGTIKRFTIQFSHSSYNSAVIMVKSKSDTKKMMADLSRLKLHDDAYEVAGEYDCCIIVSGSSVGEIDKKIDEIRKQKTVSDTKTYIVLKHW